MTGADDCVAECALGVGSGKERFSDDTKLGGFVNVVAGLVCLESGGEFVGVVEDFLGGAGHGGHLRYLGRATMAWRIDRVVAGVDDADLEPMRYPVLPPRGTTLESAHRVTLGLLEALVCRSMRRRIQASIGFECPSAVSRLSSPQICTSPASLGASVLGSRVTSGC